VSQDVQTAYIRFVGERTERSALMSARVKIVEEQRRRPQSFLLLSRNDGQRARRTPLFGRGVVILRASRTEDDEQPSFVDNCICIKDQSTQGFILAFPSAAIMKQWCDRLCDAGCVMRDLADQVVITDAPMDDVHLVRPTTTRTATMADVVVLKSTTADDKKAQLLNEAQFLLKLNNPRIPRAYGLYDVKIKGERGLGLLLDYKSGFDLADWIPGAGFQEWVVQGIVAQIVKAVTYLHERSILHRDIKPSNVFCQRGDDGSVQVVLGDLGLAIHVEEEDLKRRCGSPGFIAPEMFEAQWTRMHSEVLSDEEQARQVMKVDVFSLGMLIYGLVLAKNPFVSPTLRQTYKNNAQGLSWSEELEALSPELLSLIGHLTARDPATRFSIYEAADHPWLDADLRALGFTGDDADLRAESVAWEVFQRNSSRPPA
jgi:serine/threonine protein kinase